MKAFAVVIVSLAAATTARAEPAAERCAAGVAFAKKADLPRAALYLEGCSDDDSQHAAAAVAKQLRASALSALMISTTPEGMIGQTDALPGEQFTTPATIWTKAGTFNVQVAADVDAFTAGKTLTKTVKVEPRSRTPVFIVAPVRPGAAKDGKVDFTEDTPEQTAHQGPPPALKHGTLLPKKYREPQERSGPELEDPFALHGTSIHWRLGARVATGIVDQGDAGLGLGVAALAARPLAGPALLTARVDWSHRNLDVVAANVGIAFELAETRSLVLSAGAAMRGEVRLQDTLAMEPVARAGIGGAADLDLAILPLPLALGLRFEQGFTELVPGARSRAVLFELGYDWR